MPNESAHSLLLNAYKMILQAYELMGYKTSEDPNFTDTAERAAKAAQDLVRPVSEVNAELDDLVGKTFPARYDQMVISKHNICFGMCPHHLLPVVYRVSLAYLPRDRVVGISKLSRLIRLMARRPVLQEELTHELAELLHKRLDSRGSAVYCEGLHMCMAARGVEAHEARLVTSAVRGVFVDQPATRQEFLDLVTATPMSLL
jgi:GTP cyclohydrolase I